MSNLSVNTITNAAGGNTAQINGMTPTADSLQGFRNRIINGDMRIDQRNAGAAVTINGSGTYTLDRWYSDDVSDGSWTIQQSSVAPAGFTNSLLVTVTAADTSLAATDRCRLIQQVEGFNSADLAWGTASASPVTLSFWVRSSVTGTFSGSLLNSAENRSYPFTYTVNSANTFEYKTITIAGETSGTWVTNNGVGIRVVWSLGMGSNFNGTAGAWNTSTNFAATGATNLIATNGATFYITGVQLEAGSVATPFERRPYGTELALCQRYFQTYLQSMNFKFAVRGYVPNLNSIVSSHILQTKMRAAPTATKVGTWTVSGCAQPTIPSTSTQQMSVLAERNAGGTGDTFFWADGTSQGITLNAEL
jgi:hypothetical protein